MCPLEDRFVTSVHADMAAAFIEAAKWHVYGGSYWDHAGERGSGKLRWGIV
jgi:hypothetical protein